MIDRAFDISAIYSHAIRWEWPVIWIAMLFGTWTTSVCLGWIIIDISMRCTCILECEAIWNSGAAPLTCLRPRVLFFASTPVILPIK